MQRRHEAMRVNNAAYCAAVARDLEVDPIGTATPVRGLIVVELALPWPREIMDAPQLQEVRALAETNRLRVLAVAPSGAEPMVRVFDRVPGRFRRLNEYRRPIGAMALVDAVAVALDRVHDLAAPAGTSPNETTTGATNPSRANGGREHSSLGELALVCTHGQRDRCCGSSGTRLYAGVVSLTHDMLSIARSSHLGGHRFAPTVMMLPSATVWASVSSEQFTQIVRREGPILTLLRHYRGNAAFAKGPAQVAERVAFADVGWDWLEWQRDVVVSSTDENGGAVVEVFGTDGHSTSRCWTVEVEVARRVPAPKCAEPIDESTPVEPEFAVGRITRE